MNRKEYKAISKEEFKEIYGYSKFIHYNAARKRFAEEIAHMKRMRPGVSIVLHHVYLGCNDYELWKDVVPMYTDYHSRLHNNPNRKGKKDTPETKAKKSAATTKMWQNKEYAKKVSDGISAAWQNDDYRKRKAESTNKTMSTKKYKDAQSKRMKQAYIDNPEYKEKISANSKRNWENSEYKAAQSKITSERNLKNWQNPEYREKMLNNKNFSTKGFHWWNNGVKNKFCKEYPEGFVKGRLSNDRLQQDN